MENLAGQEDYSLTPLQRHVEFFDRNKDGIIYPRETYTGLRAIGFNVPLSVFATIFINVGLSGKTSKRNIPSISFPIYVKNIHLCRHGNDSGIYDEGGRFVPHVFEQLFNKYSRTNPNMMTLNEIDEMRKSFRRDSSFGGKVASFLEWRFTFLALKDKDGFVHKEDVKRIYDGTIFYYVEEKLKKEKDNNKKENSSKSPTSTS